MLSDELLRNWPYYKDIADLILAITGITISVFVVMHLSRKGFTDIVLKPPDIKDSLSELQSAKSVQEVAASQIKLLSSYYNNVLSQSQRSFYSALAAAGFGLLFFMAAGSFLLLYNLQSLALITTLGGALSTFVSGINFHIYNKSALQLADFHQRLDMTQRFLLSDSLCNSIKDASKQDATRSELIMNIVGTSLRDAQNQNPNEPK